MVNTTDDGSYQLATPYTPDEVGEWQIKAEFAGSTTLKATQRSSTFKVVKGTAVIAFDNEETAALGTELELVGNLNPQLAEQKVSIKIIKHTYVFQFFNGCNSRFFFFLFIEGI